MLNSWIRHISQYQSYYCAEFCLQTMVSNVNSAALGSDDYRTKYKRLKHQLKQLIYVRTSPQNSWFLCSQCRLSLFLHNLVYSAQTFMHIAYYCLLYKYYGKFIKLCNYMYREVIYRILILIAGERKLPDNPASSSAEICQCNKRQELFAGPTCPIWKNQQFFEWFRSIRQLWRRESEARASKKVKILWMHYLKYTEKSFIIIEFLKK